MNLLLTFACISPRNTFGINQMYFGTVGAYPLSKIILPEITPIDKKSIEVLSEVALEGTNLIATNRSLSDHPDLLLKLFGAKIMERDHDGSGYYLNSDNKKLFKSFGKQTLLFWKAFEGVVLAYCRRKSFNNLCASSV